MASVGAAVVLPPLRHYSETAQQARQYNCRSNAGKFPRERRRFAICEASGILVWMEKETLPPANFALTAAIFEGSLVFLAVGLGWLLDRSPLETLHWDVWAVLVTPLAVLPPLGLVLLCLWRPLGMFADIMQVVDQMLAPLFRQCSAAEMAIISLLAGLGEEMLFRGVFQAAIAHWAENYGGTAAFLGGTAADWFAVAATGVLFGLAHSINRSYTLLAGLVGLYLGWLWMVSGSLLLPVAVHALYDFLVLIYLVKIRRPRPESGAS